MEYCDRPECAGLHGKRKVHIPGMLLAAAVLAAALCKLAGIKFTEPVPLQHSANARATYGSRIQREVQPEVPVLQPGLLLPEVPVLQPNLPPEVPADSEAQFLYVPAIPEAPLLSDMPPVPQIPVFTDTPAILEGQLLPGIPSVPAPSVPEDDGIQPLPADPAIPNTSQVPEAQEPPSETPAIPDGSGSTKLPPENIVPDTPPETVPGNPAEQEKPDASGGEDSVQAALRGFNVNGEGMIDGYDPSAGLAAEGTLTLPCEGCTGIARGAFEGAGAGIYELYIPSNITNIEPGALTPLYDLGWIELKGSNPSYECFEGVLFDSTLSALVSFPAARTGKYGMPGFTARLEDYSFLGTQISKLDMRDCGIVEVGKKSFGDTGVSKVTVAAPRQYMEEYKTAFTGTGVLVK